MRAPESGRRTSPLLAPTLIHSPPHPPRITVTSPLRYLSVPPATSQTYKMSSPFTFPRPVFRLFKTLRLCRKQMATMQENPVSLQKHKSLVLLLLPLLPTLRTIMMTT